MLYYLVLETSIIANKGFWEMRMRVLFIQSNECHNHSPLSACHLPHNNGGIESILWKCNGKDRI